MKKFYSTLALAAAVALSASAADYKAKSLESKFGNMPIQEVAMGAINAQQPMKVASAVAKSKPTSVSDVYGYYRYVYRNIYVKGWSINEGSLTLYPGKEANEVYIDGVNNDYPIVGIFDASAGTLTIADHQDAFYSTYYSEMAYFEHIEAYLVPDEKNPEESNWTIRDVNTPLVLTFDENGSLVFPENHGFKIAIEAGGWLGCMFVQTVKLSAPNNSGWSKYGQASFTDGWFVNGMAVVGYGGQVSFPALDVQLYRNNDNPNLYRLYNPYEKLNALMNFDEPEDSEDYLPFNQTYVDGCIEFDVTNPACVVVKPNVYSGLDCPIWALGLFYMYNSAGQYVYIDGPAEDESLTFEEQIDAYKEFAEANGDADKLSTYNADSHMVVIKDGVFDMSNYSGYHTWDRFAALLMEADPDVFGNIPLPIDMTTVILLPDPAGLNNIITDNSNNTLEYFNLQGVRVNNPSNGIYIRRQGNDVQKVYVR